MPRPDPVTDGGGGGAGAGVPLAPSAGPALPGLLGPWPPRRRWPEPLHRAMAAVRDVLEQAAGPDDAPGSTAALVALSGGADSLALAVTCAVLAGTRAGGRLGGVGAVVVDHGLQDASAAVAAAAAETARALGLDPVRQERVHVERAGRGPEAEAREARRKALARAARALAREAAAASSDASAGSSCGSASAGRESSRVPVVLTAHTADDQAEQVLLGLARGSGTRSLAGIPGRGELPGGVDLARPMLGLTRADTEAICRWAGLTWFEDPHNRDPVLLRSRIRTRLLPALEDPDGGLGPGLRAALVRTAEIAAEDAAALEAWAEGEFRRLAEAGDGGGDGGALTLALAPLAALPTAVRHRIVARAVRAVGGEAPTRERVLAVDALVTSAHVGGASAGPIELAGGVEAWRRRGGGEGTAAGAMAGPMSDPAASCPTDAAGAVVGRPAAPVTGTTPAAPDVAPCGRLAFIRRRPGR